MALKSPANVIVCEKRLALMTQADEISKEIRACIECRILRDKRQLLIEMAETLLVEAAVEADDEHGVRKVRKVVTKPEVDVAEAE